jgi:hypothetical protein
MQNRVTGLRLQARRLNVKVETFVRIGEETQFRDLPEAAEALQRQIGGN